MNIILFRGFNNYFNRTVKIYDNLLSYETESTSYLDIPSINFNPNDGIATELIIGNPDQIENSKPLDWTKNGTPDYAICYELTGPDSTLHIRSRWFVLESERTRNGQYRVALKRDVLADNYSSIMRAPCFVEKGSISSSSDPLLFNHESLTFNQIKQSETLLKDETKTGWLIGYVSQDKTRYPTSQYYESTSAVPVLASVYEWLDVPQDVRNAIQWGVYKKPVAKANTSWGIPAGRVWFTTNWQFISPNYQAYCYQAVRFSNVPWVGEIVNASATTVSSSPIIESGIVLGISGSSTPHTIQVDRTSVGGGGVNFLQAIRNDSTLRNYYVTYQLSGRDVSDELQATIESWNGKYVKKDGKYYRLSFTASERKEGPLWTISTSQTTYWNKVISLLNTEQANNPNGIFFENTGIGNNNYANVKNSQVAIVGNGQIRLAWEYQDMQLEMVEISADLTGIVKTYMPATRNQATDTPMDLFAIPYSDTPFEIYDQATAGEPSHTTYFSKEIALQAAMSLGQAGANVYDIQLLPYFPDDAFIGSAVSDGLIWHNGWFKAASSLTQDQDYTNILDYEDNPIGVIFWPKKSIFTRDIALDIALDNTNPLTLKISNECDLYRITSPNYAGSFEFSVAKSGGRITKVNVDATYKPYSPYIHVNPDLAGLYGENFFSIDDARGLTCGGDFSITRWTSSWETYQLQNKNYQEIFNRQIQNMDVSQQIAREQLDWQVLAGYLGGGIGGAATGAIAGAKAGPYGAVAGAIGGAYLGTVGAAIGGELDKDWLARTQQESKSYTTDMYNYQLGNIQALPYSIARTTAITNNNRLWPFIEYFTCTDAEKGILRDKLRYNGMTVMKIGRLLDYSTSTDFDKVYVKGQIIRLDNLNDDFHVADVIYQEVNKGFFIPQ